MASSGLDRSQYNGNVDADYSHDKYEEEDMDENELFNSDPDQKHKPWWQTTFMLTGTVKFGTWDGVFTSCMLNIFGVVIFLRTGWMVGYAGLGLSFLIVFMTMLIGLVTTTSAVGVCERCQIESGGVYFLLTHVLGAQLSTAVGILYCFGQAIASSLYVTGFGESICGLFGWTNQWIAKGIGSGVLSLLLIINLAGVKWVIRLQLILLLILSISVLDFMVGSFVKQTPELGTVGYSLAIFQNNTAPQFTDKIGFFTVFGVFFPTATGICAGINMSGNLHNPRKSIPDGTLAAVLVSTILYLCFVIALGGTCLRYVLQTDTLITAKVASLGPLLLFGLYVSSLSAALGGVSTAPRLLVVICDTSKLPGSNFISKTWGSNQVPAVSILVVVCVALIFVLIGDINVLGPIVTMPFLLTYASLTYSYFALARSFDIRQRREKLYAAINQSGRNKSAQINNGVATKTKTNGLKSKSNDFKTENESFSDESNQGELNNNQNKSRNSIKQGKDLDMLFPERKYYGTMSDTEEGLDQKKITKEIIRQPRSYYSVLINRWISLAGSVIFLMLMLAVDWSYALIVLCLYVVLYFYIGWLSPGLFPGVCEFSLWRQFNQILTPSVSRNCDEEHLIPPQRTPPIYTKPACISEFSEDFNDRDNFHKAKKIQNDDVTKAFSGTTQN